MLTPEQWIAVQLAQPPQVIPLSPQNGETIYTLKPTLSARYDCASSSGSISFEIDNNTLFKSAKKQTLTVNGLIDGDTASFTLTTALDEIQWWWRVKADTTDGQTTGWSGPQQVVIDYSVMPRVRFLYLDENVGQDIRFNSQRILHVDENVGQDVRAQLQYKRLLTLGENVGQNPIPTITNRTLFEVENVTNDAPVPWIISLDRQSAFPGEAIVINGGGFGYSPADDPLNADTSLRSYGGKVYLGELECEVTAWSWTSITIVVPAMAPAGFTGIKVTLTTPDPPGPRDSNMAVFTVLGNSKTQDIGIELKVASPTDPNVILDILDAATSRAFQKQMNGPGAGKFTISRLDKKGGNPDLIKEANIIKCYLNEVEQFAWIIESVVPHDVDGNQAELLEVSGRGCLALLDNAIVYPAGYPNYTALDRKWVDAHAGAILDQLLQEAQARGALRGVTWDFTAAADSGGNPWTDNTFLQIHTGITLLQVVEQLTARGVIDFEMDSGLVLHAFPRIGADVSEKVVFFPGGGLLTHQKTTDAKGMYNVILAEGDENKVNIVEDLESQSAYGRREGYLQTSGLNDSGLIADYANAILNNVKKPSWSTAIDVDLWPYHPVVDYSVGDTIAVRTQTGVNDENLRVIALTVEDAGDDFGINITLDLNTVFKEREIKIQQWLARMTNNNIDPSLSSQDQSQKAPIDHNHDHGTLAGLADDDHPQYLNELRHEEVDHTGLPGIGGSLAVQGQPNISGAVTLISGNNIALTEDAVAKTIKVDGVSLIAGSNVTLTKDDAANAITIAATGGGGGGSTGVNRNWHKFYSNATPAWSTSAYLTKGIVIEPVSDIKLWGIGMTSNEATAASLALSVYELNGTTQVGAALARVNVTGPNPTPGLVSTKFAQAITLLAGHRYVVAISNTTAGATYVSPCSTAYPVNERSINGFQNTYYTRIAGANPAAGSIWELGTATIPFNGAILIEE